MKRFFLKDPIYSEPDHNSVLLILDNNIVMRGQRKEESMLKNQKIQEAWNSLNLVERNILTAIFDKGEITSGEVAKIINRGKTTTVKLLNKLMNMKLIEWTGTNKNDAHGKYIINKY